MLAPEMSMFMRTVYAALAKTSTTKHGCTRTPDVKQNTASQRIVAELRTKIRSGRLRTGERVPSARQIKQQYGVALATATKVLAALKREGLVKPQPGVGTVVRGTSSGPD